MVIFEGLTQAAAKEAIVKEKVAKLATKPQVAAVLFTEDPGSRLYTRLKKEAAERVGIGYHLFEFSIKQPVAAVLQKIEELNNDKNITGIIIQKPTKKIWESNLETEQGRVDGLSYNDWWSALVSSINEDKDVDGLHPSTLAAVADGTWQEKGRVLPATCQAVVDILTTFCGSLVNKEPEEIRTDSAFKCLENKKIIILGKSDLLGKPLFYYLQHFGYSVEMIGSKELGARNQLGIGLRDADVIISATGWQHLVTGEMVREGVAVVDVGEPKPDVEFATVNEKAGFITPVPGGVGPMTVVCLLENAVRLVEP